MQETVRIETQGAGTLPLTKFVHFQGNLKTLAEEDYQRLKKDILELGFSEPVSVWQSDGKSLILNGHQRIRALRKMAEEGYQVPDVPVNWIQAKSLEEAKRKVLSLTSQFGKMDSQGLYEFIHESGIQPDEMFERYRFPEINIPKFTEEFFIDRSPVDDMDIGKGVEQTYEPADDGSKSVQDMGEAGQLEPNSHVKMVQIFLSSDNHEQFKEMCEFLQGRFEKDNLTDTIFAAVEKAYEVLSTQG